MFLLLKLAYPCEAYSFHSGVSAPITLPPPPHTHPKIVLTCLCGCTTVCFPSSLLFHLTNLVDLVNISLEDSLASLGKLLKGLLVIGWNCHFRRSKMVEYWQSHIVHPHTKCFLQILSGSHASALREKATVIPTSWGERNLGLSKEILPSHRPLDLTLCDSHRSSEQPLLSSQGSAQLPEAFSSSPLPHPDPTL